MLGDGLQGLVQLMQKSAMGQYQVTLHHCTKTAAEQLFLITEQSIVWIPSSANLLCAYMHDIFECASQGSLCVVFAGGEQHVPIPSDVRLRSDSSKVGLAQTEGQKASDAPLPPRRHTP